MKTNKLKSMFKEFQRTPFPKGSSYKDLSLIHAELVEYDGYVAGLISGNLVE